MHKQVQFKTLGMNRDLSESSFSPKFAYENKNIRIVPTEDNTLYSIVNEKGNLDTGIKLIGIPIGQAVIDDVWVIFTHDVSATGSSPKDYIYKITIRDTIFKEDLYYGDLNLSIDYPIETLICVENEKVKKVYWVDGINQPRVINIAATTTGDIGNNLSRNSPFDFAKELELKEDITINTQLGEGEFTAGVIQYAFSYYNLYGSESNIFYTSPLKYISNVDRGAETNEKCNCSFSITVKNVDTNFDYLRIYSIHRTSIDATPTVKNVIDLPVPKNKDHDETGDFYYIIRYTDTGKEGYIIDPVELLYKGGDSYIAGTINQKDNTLFLGDLTINRKNLTGLDTKDIYIEGYTVDIENTDIELGVYYSYNNQLKLNPKNASINTFKYGEWYRFGIQFQHRNGKWSDPIFIEDKKTDIHPQINTNIKLPIYKIEIPADKLSIAKEKGYIRIRGVVVFPSESEREVKAQGIVCPTVYNVQDRYTNSPFVQASWFSRFMYPYDYESTTYKPTLTEFRHNYPIPDNLNYNAEIQSIVNPPESPFIKITSEDDSSSIVNNFIENNKGNFFVDQSILTFHSPDIEFGDIKSIIENNPNIKLRITGLVKLDSFMSDIDIQTDTPPLINDNKDTPFRGFYKEIVGIKNDFVSTRVEGQSDFFSCLFYNTGLTSAPFWRDGAADNDGKEASFDGVYTQKSYIIYPWHRNGSLNDQVVYKDYKSALLKYKKMSNLKFSNSIHYLSEPWRPTAGITKVNIFNSNEKEVIKIDAPKNSNLSSLNYYGNIDKVITGRDYGIAYHLGNVFWSLEYPKRSEKATDPIRMKYKSTPHAIFAFNYTNKNEEVILPSLSNSNHEIPLNRPPRKGDNEYSFWDLQSTTNTKQDFLRIDPSVIGKSYLYLAELYDESIVNRFGGTSEEALTNNLWLPAGEPVRIIDDNNELKNTVTVTFKYGDTFFQRYDCLKTYPYTLEDQNSIVEIVSFMCETRVNIDGRYDRNRGQISNLTMTPTNFNLLNNIYTQKNNFFNYRKLNTKYFNIDRFPNMITWSKTKTSGELVDNWTNITLASVLDLDGDKGPVRAIKKFNNTLLAFQDKGISQILYNENIQIASTEGVPIEIANSGKVSGKRYFTEHIGCTNKWSMCETPYGIYFIDDLNKGIYLFNGKVENISSKFGFDSWIKKKSNTNIWNPNNFSNFVTYYDKVNKDVLFIDSEDCLAFSETLGQFSSFYSYEGTPYLANIKDKVLTLGKNNSDSYSIWLHNGGEYNKFYNNYKPFYTTVIVNPEMNKDKIFNTLEFRSDSWDNEGNLLNTTFDKLEVWNEYQHGISNLENVKGFHSNLKKKFRIWRANIPRDASNGRDRIRNPWTYIKLSKEENNTDKTVLHDLIVTYFD